MKTNEPLFFAASQLPRTFCNPRIAQRRVVQRSAERAA